MADQTDGQALRSLAGDEHLLELDHFVPPLRIVRSLGVGRNEVAHSQLLAALLSPQQHRGAEIMLRTLLWGVLRQQHLTGATSERLREILGASWTHVNVQREFQFIDLVVQITSLQHTVIVGIENKIDAGEGDEQLGRYQGKLESTFPDQTSIMVFLTPTGRGPTTALSHSSVPVISVGYDLIVEAVEEAWREAEPESRDQHALSEIVAHLKEDILGEETEVKTLVRELWKAHGKALHLAMEHRPRLEDVRTLYEALLRERFGDDAHIYYWRSRGELREIKMRLHSWANAGFPFEFMLYVADGLPVVRLLIWGEAYNAHAASLKEWAHDVNALAPALIDEEFTKLPRWGWRRVFLEESYPPEAILDDQAFDEVTARAAVEAVVALFEKLQPYIKAT